MDLVTGELTSGPYYDGAKAMAESYPNIPFPEGWKANIFGIDTNLQYPAGWEEARRIKFSQGFVRPGPRDYVGNAPLEAPESRGMYQITAAEDPALTIAYHSQGREIYWKYLDIEPPGAAAIARRFAKLTGYRLEDVPFASGHAGYKDWFILDYNRPGFTFEVGYGVNPLPLSQFDMIYAENLRVLSEAPLLIEKSANEHETPW
jgi:g-D-glutamyl-meso-diaminopimelate peptidase